MMHVFPVVVNGAPQRMVLPDGSPKGLKMVLEERGVDVRKMKKEDIVAKLSTFDDFKNEIKFEHFFCLNFTRSSMPLSVCGEKPRYTHQ